MSEKFGDEFMPADGTDISQLKAEISQLRLSLEEAEQKEKYARQRLESLLWPDYEIEDLELSSILNKEEIQSMMEHFCNLLNIPMAIIDLSGRVLVGVGWQKICTEFHRVHPATCRNCIESDTELTTGIPEGRFKLYKCRNGMWDLATPIIIRGRHLGNLFLGQFFFSSEPPDVEYFRRQAREYGFDEKEYIEALRQVPHLNDRDLESAKALFLKIARSISELSYSNMKLAHSLNERILLMNSLKETQDNIRAILDATQESVFMCDAKGNLIVANLMASKRLNCPVNEIPGRNMAEFLPLDVARGRMKYVDEVFTTGKSAVFEDEYNNETFRHNLFPVFENGRVKRLVCYSQDITEHKKAEEQLRKLSRAVEQAPSSIVITDKKGRIEYVNPKFTSLTGYTSEEVLGHNPSIMQSGRTDPEIYKNLWSTIKSGSQWQGTLLNRKKNGELFWESISISPVLDPDGDITHYTAVKEDTTRQKKREEQLHKLNRTLAALRHSGEALVRAEDEKSYLNEVCRIVVEDCGHALMWIGFTEMDDYKSVSPAAAAGFEEDYLKELKISWADTERGRGPTGSAIRTGEVILCRSIPEDPNFQPWRSEAVKRGFSSAISLPLKNEGTAFGAITIYDLEPDSFSDDEVNLLSELAEDLAYGITILRLRQAHRSAEEELKNHRDNLELLVQNRTQELETANEILKEAQKVAHIGHWRLELKDNRLLWSDEIFRIFGIEPNSFGATLEAFMHFVHPDDQEMVARSFMDSVRNRTPYSIEHRIVRPGGEIRIVQERCINHYDNSGAPLYSLGVVQDITELKRVQKEIEEHKDRLEELVRIRTEELAIINSQLKIEIEKKKQVELLLKESLKKERELNELKSRFISTISHEFRTPLTSILSSMQLVQRYRKRWDDTRIDEEFLRAKDSIFYLTQLLDDILTISRAESGKIILNPQPFDLNEFCLRIIEEVKHLAGEGHEFTFTYTAEERIFMLDPKLLRFIIINLLSNAFKYSPEGGKVDLKASSDPAFIQIEVSDEGIGIPKKDRIHLFTPFFRAGNTSEIEGKGLGLSIVQKSVELHEGTISCSSKLGKGTRFTVKIPRGKNDEKNTGH
ncbi:MAG TPA: PocR ligand-binding domain-containing protein [Ignavibacteriales bacterium]|nr:PocR ligand-binding domain-containing protein [Ignavibacteriales bacterium]